MKAVVYDRYGPPDVLRLADVPVPRPGPGHVLVEVVATSVNLSDWETLVGSPLYARIGGLVRPARPILGSDIAGRVAAVGPDVSRFREGDEVYGDNLDLKGGFAEFALAPESVLAHKPGSLTFSEASTIPQAAAIAGQGVAGVEPGERLLINGAGGGAGSLAVQLAKLMDAHVTGVDSGAKLAFMRSLGADEVLDFERTDFTRTGERYDRILDLVARRSVADYRRAMTTHGRYACVGGAVSTMIRVGLAGLFSARRFRVLAVRQGPEHFAAVTERCVRGEVDLHIEAEFPLERTADALAHHGEGRTLGKVVVRPRST